MGRIIGARAALLLCLMSLNHSVFAADWVEGRNYVRLDPAQGTHVPAGKVEVMEVFSYACPFCYRFQPVMQRLQHQLPADAKLTFLPAAFHPEEDWTVFQRGYFAAQSLGIALRAHEAIFDAVWKTGELAIIDPATNRLKEPLPSIEDVARGYARLTGVKQKAFLAAARSAAVDAKMRTADAQIVAMRVPGTPCLIVNGKYMVVLDSLHTADEVVAIVDFLVAKERGG